MREFTPKMSIASAANFLQVTPPGVHQKLKAKNLVCPKKGNKLFLTNKQAKELFELKFKPKTITCQIVKGGTGKTTVVQNIACCAVTYGARVLLVDLDPQGNLTDSFDLAVGDDLPILIDIFKKEADVEDAIVTLDDGLDILPSSIENVILDNVLLLQKYPLDQVFSQILDPVKDNYDFIFIDCPPTLGASVTAAALYADTVLAPLNPDRFSAKGLNILKNEVENMQEIYKRVFDFKVFLNKYSGNTILSDKAIHTLLSDPDMEGRILNTAVRFAQEIPNLIDEGQNLFATLKKSTARDDFDQLTRELLAIEPPKQASVQPAETQQQEASAYEMA